MTTSEPARPLLLVLAHGIGPAELERLRAGSAWSGTMPAAPVALPDRPVRDVLQDLDATDALHDLGVAVDRSCLVLRPTGRPDASAAERLARRATGPAAVTLFEARDVLAQAMVGNAATAIQQLGQLVAHLAERLRHGDLPELWFVGLGSPVPVATTFDLEAAWRRHVLPPLASDLTLRCAPGSATMLGDNQRALDLAAQTLRRAPFAAHGKVTSTDHSRLRFEAAPGVAFAAHRVAARAPLPHEANGIACAPLGDLVRVPDLDLAQVLARFWTRAAMVHVDVAEVRSRARTPVPVDVDRVAAPTAVDLPLPTPQR